MASPASNASRGHETGAGTASSTGNSPASSNRPAVDLTAITTRDDFLLEIGEALGGQASVRPVDSIAGALEFLVSTKRGQVLAVDTRDLLDVRADVEQAHAQAPHAVVLVFVTAEAEKQISAAVKGSNVFAVLPIPIDKRKTNAVLDAAMTDAVAKKATARANPGMTVESFQPRLDGGSSAPPPEREKSKAPLFAALGVVAVAAAGGGYWFLNKDKGAAPPPVVNTPKAAAPAQAAAAGAAATDDTSANANPTVDTSIVNGKVDELLEKARLAMRERRYLEPIGDNALLYYRSAAAADPNSGEAKDGLQRVAGVAASRFDESMNAGKFDDASLALANLKVAALNDARVPPDELKLTTAQINKALADGNLDRASALVRQAQQSSNIPPDQLTKWRTEIGRRQEDAKVQRLANLVSDRIRDGKLVDPADDDAKTYVQQLHEVAPSNPITQRAVRELDAAYMRKAREAAASKSTSEVDRWLAEARAGGVSAAEITSFQRDQASVRQKAVQAEIDRLAQTARDRIRDGKLTDPANDSAAFYLTQLQSTDAANPAFTQVSHDLAAKLLDRARQAELSGKPMLADPDLTQAKRWGADPKDILAVQQTVGVPKPATGGPTRSAAAAAGLTPAQLAANLKRLKYVPPEFPSKALTQRVSGSVTIEYIVDTNGDPRDVRVVEATPPGVFDHAAITAVKHWHYEPVVANGAPVEVPVRTAIRFELPPQ
ncbi:MAG TPA: energy transducer TonB [Steroidobacteraceae bacterium]|nr:energy transducer TonB [Steroidobacteraceae bacterium]